MKRHGRAQWSFQAILCVLLIASPARSRKHPAEPSTGAGGNPEVLHVTTQLVQVNVIVKDRRGQLVAGLARGDFAVYDDGKPQKIAIFRVEQSRPPVALPPVPSDIFTNIPERQAGTSPAVTAILLDGLNTRWEDQVRSAQQVVKFLRTLQPDDRVALYTLGTRLVMLHDFTDDSKALVQALAHYHGRLNTEVEASEADRPENTPEWVNGIGNSSGDIPSAAVTDEIRNWLADAVSLEARYYMDRRVEMTVDALAAIAEHLRGVPGRKNLIWVSSAFPLLRGIDDLIERGSFAFGSTYGIQVSRATEALNDANLAIYPVDARGLMVDPFFSAARSGGSLAQLRRPRMASHLTDNFATMDEFAERTGGRAFYNTNDIRGAVRRVIDDSRLTYLLGYYPTDTEWNGKFHKINVKVDRPGLRLQYRDGYAALPEQPPASPVAEKTLSAAVLSPLDATGVAIAVKATPAKSAAGAPRSVLVQFWINSRDITLTPDGRKWAVRLTTVVEEFGPQGQSVKGVSNKISFKVKAGMRENFLSSGLHYNTLLAIMPGVERLRVVVRDDPSGNLGSVSIPLDRVLPQPPG